MFCFLPDGEAVSHFCTNVFLLTVRVLSSYSDLLRISQLLLFPSGFLFLYFFHFFFFFTQIGDYLYPFDKWTLNGLNLVPTQIKGNKVL